MDYRMEEAGRRCLIHDTEDHNFLRYNLPLSSLLFPCPSLNTTDRRESEPSEKLGCQVYAFSKFSIPC